MERVLHSQGRAYVLRRGLRRDLAENPKDLGNDHAARSFLWKAFDDVGTLAPLRGLLEEEGLLRGAHQAGSAEVVAVAAAAVAAGTLRLDPWKAEPMEFHEVLRPSRPAALAAPPPEKKKEPPKLTWIEIELVGEDDKPIPGEAYEVQFPNRLFARGVLDENGKARLLTEPGTCKVTFPDLDKEAWERA